MSLRDDIARIIRDADIGDDGPAADAIMERLRQETHHSKIETIARIVAARVGNDITRTTMDDIRHAIQLIESVESEVNRRNKERL